MFHNRDSTLARSDARIGLKEIHYTRVSGMLTPTTPRDAVPVFQPQMKGNESMLRNYPV
jgi:hypothetical protein